MRMRASDLPADGTIKRCIVTGILFEVRRWRSLQDGRKFTYAARQIPDTGTIDPDAGWWQRFSWDLMVRDIKLMAKKDLQA